MKKKEVKIMLSISTKKEDVYFEEKTDRIKLRFK